MPANPQVTDEMCLAAAQSDGEFDGRGWMAMPRAERERYLERSRKALTAALADHVVGWRDIESAPDNKSVLLGWFDWRDGQWCTEVGAAITGQRFDNGYSNVSKHGSATHWMPLPAAPLPQKEG